jgi:putative selenium metabolism hydrolase
MNQAVSPAQIETLRSRVAEQRDNLIQFLREICAIPSMDSQIGAVGERIGAEMRKLGFDEVRFDKMGNILGRIGNGRRVVVYDSHIDTVGIGDRAEWVWDPFIGKIEGGQFFARGACDEKGSTPGMIYGLALAREFGWLEDLTVYYFGNMEEWCDGIAPNSFVMADPMVRPDVVVIGEPTQLRVYRGHKGRLELKITATGKSAHAAHHHLGDNAVYKMVNIIQAVRELDRRLGRHPFLGKATVAVTDVVARTASINAVPDQFTIFLDRRVTVDEDRKDVLGTIRGLIPDYLQDEVKVEELYYDTPSYTGFVFPVDKFYPAWVLEDEHPLVQAGQQTVAALWGETRPTGKWDFSTNGTYWAGKAKIPSIGFGPGNEEWAHMIDEHIDLDEVVRATEWYALFPAMLGR